MEKIRVELLKDDGDAKKGEVVIMDFDIAEEEVKLGNARYIEIKKEKVIKCLTNDERNVLERTKGDNQKLAEVLEKESLDDMDVAYCKTMLKSKEINPTALKEIYEGIKDILKDFIDTREENYELISLWIIGTYLHNYFETFPYLFFNAMRGSGKTRILKLIKELAWEGDMLTSLSEAVLFRTTGTLCIDEFESVGGKDKNNLMELLNTGYKRGGKVKRMKKKNTAEGTEQVVEEFNTFRPISMANIWGMEEVLGDRCITLIIEKSSNPIITRKIENFSSNPKIIKTKELIKKTENWCRLCSVVSSKNMYNDWNDYLLLHTTLNTNNTNNTNNILFDKIINTQIDGRNLELTFPLLLIADDLGILDKIIDIINKMIIEKKEEEISESKDVLVFQLVSNQTAGEWIKVEQLKNTLDFILHGEKNDWLNNHWMGRCLKRLNLIVDKRRLSDGREVTLNVAKAKKQLEMFK